MGTPIVAICPPDSILNTQTTVYLEAEETLSGRFICLRKMEMCRKCKEALKQLCCGKWRRAGGGEGPRCSGTPGVSSCLQSLLGEGGCGPGSEGRVSSPALARQTPVGRSGPLLK